MDKMSVHRQGRQEFFIILYIVSLILTTFFDSAANAEIILLLICYFAVRLDPAFGSNGTDSATRMALLTTISGRSGKVGHRLHC